ncbi:MAG TPA: DUF1178 family protein [Vicinamibacterales bacterium]
MKVFNLCCDIDHAFEGWFASHEEFDRQLDAGLVQCPVCGTRAISKMPSAPRLNISGAQEPAPQAAPKEPVAMPNEAAMRAMLAQMARHIIANTEDVGERFPEEARRIHYEEAPRRSIRGVASKEEAADLEDEGIDVMPVPFADLLKNSLN